MGTPPLKNKTTQGVAENTKTKQPKGLHETSMKRKFSEGLLKRRNCNTEGLQSVETRIEGLSMLDN